MILLYHNVLPDDSPAVRFKANLAISQSAFQRQLRWLSKHRRIVSLETYLAEMWKAGSAKSGLAAITFDDGFSQTFDCIFPLILEMKMPVTIFAATRHLDHGELLWFSYLKALSFESDYDDVICDGCSYKLLTFDQQKNAWINLREMAVKSGDPVEFCRKMGKSYPVEADVERYYAGMTGAQIQEACESGLIEFGSHTVNHPFLDQLELDAREQEISGSKEILSGLTGKPVRFFAYPGGAYDSDTVALVKKAGYEAAFATIPQNIANPQFEIERMGIYSRSMLKFQLKMIGTGNLLRHLGIRTG